VIGFLVLSMGIALGAAIVRAWDRETDAEIVARVLEGNTGAYEALVTRYQRRLYAVVRRIAWDRDAADDLVQESFIRAFQALARYDATRSFGAWISKIALNAALTFAAAERRRGEGSSTENLSHPPEPFDNAASSELSSAVQCAIAELPDGIRETFVLRAYGDLSYDEIADALAIPKGTVMSRLARARERLVKSLEPYAGNYHPDGENQ
jgi:RNA polymerase sigma-70 factor (ECF subfamily)